MYKNFDDFLDQQQPKSGLPPMGLQQRKDEWLDALESLYSKIESILKPYTDKQRITFLPFQSDITEEQLGSYSVRTARIVLQGDCNSQVTLNPIGTFVIGARGRVDMVGPTGKTVKLLRVTKDATKAGSKFKVNDALLNDSPPINEIEWVWKIAFYNPPDLPYLELTDGNFLEALMFVMER